MFPTNTTATVYRYGKIGNTEAREATPVYTDIPVFICPAGVDMLMAFELPAGKGFEITDNDVSHVYENGDLLKTAMGDFEVRQLPQVVNNQFMQVIQLLAIKHI